MIDATIIPTDLTEIGKIEGTTAVKIVNEMDIEIEIETGIERKTERVTGNEFTIATVGGTARTEINEVTVLANRAAGGGRISSMMYCRCISRLHYIMMSTRNSLTMSMISQNYVVCSETTAGSYYRMHQS